MILTTLIFFALYLSWLAISLPTHPSFILGLIVALILGAISGKLGAAIENRRNK